MDAPMTATQPHTESNAPREPDTMRAILQRAYGDADQLALETVARPTPAAGEVLLRVAAAGLNPADWFVMRGDPYLIRLGYGLRRPKHPIQGQDVAGVVVAVGEGVTRFQAGDEVFGYGHGAFAEFMAVPEKQLQPRPAHLTLEQAATLAIAGLTALHALRDQAKVQPGQKVLIIAAAGGVGQFAVQMAKAYGAHVTGVCSTRNVERVLANGADEVIDYTTQDFTAAGPRYDVVVRLAGGNSVAECRSALLPSGTLVIVGGGTYGSWLGGMERFLGTKLLGIFTRQRLRPFISMLNPDDLAALRDLVEQHAIEPVMDRRFPLEETPNALTYVGTGHARGKVVVTP